MKTTSRAVRCSQRNRFDAGYKTADMLGQAIPFGINLSSPVSWFFVAVVFIVLALTLSTRRGTGRPRQRVRQTPQKDDVVAPLRQEQTAVVQPLSADVRLEYEQEWANVQALFVQDPRSACLRAHAVVEKIRRARGVAAGPQDVFAREESDNGEPPFALGATTDELRQRFLELRSTFEALRA